MSKKEKQLVTKVHKAVANLVILGLRIREDLLNLDMYLDNIADYADPSHPKHKLFVEARQELRKSEKYRSQINTKLRTVGIELR